MRLRNKARSTVPLVLAILAWVAQAGCDRSSPTSPGDPQAVPALNVEFADSPAILPHQAQIRSILQQSSSSASQVLPVGFVRFSVLADRSRTIPGWSLGGYALSDSEIEIVIDPEAAGLAEILALRLPQISAHELHHVVRWRGPGPYTTLLEALVFEGLADHFSIEQGTGGVPPWADAFSEAETQKYWTRALPELDQAFDFEAWFFGFGTDLPTWTGYTLGFRLVRDYLDQNPGATAASLVHTPAESFRP